MASVIDTESSLTTELEHFTEIHAHSGLENNHLSRRTKTGFLITQDRLLTRGTGAWDKRVHEMEIHQFNYSSLLHVMS